MKSKVGFMLTCVHSKLFSVGTVCVLVAVLSLLDHCVPITLYLLRAHTPALTQTPVSVVSPLVNVRESTALRVLFCQVST